MHKEELFGALVGGVLVLLTGIFIGSGCTAAAYRWGAIEAGVGQYNPTTSRFEWKKVKEQP